MSASKANAAVRRGVKLLDKVAPGWWKPSKISLGKLDMADGCYCIAGQLSEKGTLPDEYSFSYSSRYGFDAVYEFPKDQESRLVADYPELHESWEREIRSRRQEAKTA